MCTKERAYHAHENYYAAFCYRLFLPYLFIRASLSPRFTAKVYNTKKNPENYFKVLKQPQGFSS